jgi:hypothetical protein
VVAGQILQPQIPESGVNSCACTMRQCVLSRSEIWLEFRPALDRAYRNTDLEET